MARTALPAVAPTAPTGLTAYTAPTAPTGLTAFTASTTAPMAPTAPVLTCGHPQLRSFLQFTEGLSFSNSFSNGNNFASTEFFNVNLSLKWHERHGLTEEQVQKMIQAFPVVEKHVGRIDRYECRPVALQPPDLREQENSIDHNATIYFCKRDDDDTFSVVITNAQQQVSFSEERFDAKVQQELGGYWEDVRNEEFEQSNFKYVRWVLPYKFIDWWCEVQSKAESKARKNLKDRCAQERIKFQEDSSVGYALYTGLQTRKLICNGPADIFPAILDQQ